MITSGEFVKVVADKVNSGRLVAGDYMDRDTYLLFMNMCNNLLDKFQSDPSLSDEKVLYMFATACFLVGFEVGQNHFGGEA